MGIKRYSTAGGLPQFTGESNWGGGDVAPALHAPQHELGGSDQINLAGLLGLLGTPQNPVDHANEHELGGGDVINVAGLSGELTDRQRFGVVIGASPIVVNTLLRLIEADGNIALALADDIINGETEVTITGRQTVALAGVEVGTRRRLNLIQGSNVTLTVVDNPGSDRVDATIAASGGPSETPVGFAFAANAASLDVSVARNYAATNTLTGNSTITLTNGTEGSWGTILVRQDATGSRTLTFTVAGRTQYRDLGVPDTTPYPAANGFTYYQYYFVTVNSVAQVIINKIPIAT